MTSILKVQNIQYTDGDAALTIADGGGVTAASTLTSTGTLTASGALEAGSIGATTVANVRFNSQGSYGGNYRAIGWDGVSNGNTHIYSQYNATDHLVLHAGTGKNIVLEAGGSSADIMTITADREVLKPYQPLWSGIRAGTRMKTSNGFTMTNDQIIPFSDYENVGNHFASNIFTCPVAGKYLCTIHGIAYSSTSTWMSLYTKLNGNVKVNAYNDIHTTWQNVSSSIILGASANDTIKFHVQFGHADGTFHEGDYGGATIHLIG